MRRAIGILAAAERDARAADDTVILDFEQRQRIQGTFVSLKGIKVELDFPQSVRLHTDDLLVLDDGTRVEIVAQPEPLIEVRAADLPSLARIAWHLGDRHTPVQVLPNRIRLRRDAAMETLLEGLGARLALIEAPFEPEGGAYEARHAHDHHRHDHGHDHAHHGCHHHHHDHE
ncbi:MAG TPA: urease accessory protein UreE [Pseudolabrys sp.]|nr:urease accessory protein UreE [Pseudolabrys sp.]